MNPNYREYLGRDIWCSELSSCQRVEFSIRVRVTTYSDPNSVDTNSNRWPHPVVGAVVRRLGTFVQKIETVL